MFRRFVVCFAGVLTLAMMVTSPAVAQPSELVCRVPDGTPEGSDVGGYQVIISNRGIPFILIPTSNDGVRGAIEECRLLGGAPWGVR